MTKLDWLAVAQKLIAEIDFNSVEYFLDACEDMGYNIDFIKMNSDTLYAHITDNTGKTIDGTLNYAATITSGNIQYFNRKMSHEQAMKMARGHAITFHMIKKADPVDIAILKSFKSLSGLGAGTGNAEKKH